VNSPPIRSSLVAAVAAVRVDYCCSDRIRSTASTFSPGNSTSQTQTGASSAGQPPAEQTTKPSAPPPPVAFTICWRGSPSFSPTSLPVRSGSLPDQKFELFVDNSISVHSITWAMIGSAVSQADDSPTGFGQGWDAYAKRFGSDMGRTASSEFFGTFLLASALHEDRVSTRRSTRVSPRHKVLGATRIYHAQRSRSRGHRLV